jgi:Zn-dependent M28 family amino/carboxypeptidase
MQFLASSTSVALALLTFAQRSSCSPYVSSEALQALVNIDDLLAGSQRLQGIADENGGTRVFGSAGHYATVDYLYDTLSALDYYNVSKQAFIELYFEGTASLTAGGVQYEPDTFTYSPSGSVTAPVVLVSDLGCDVGDFPAEVAGNIALVLRGNCTFALKATNAKAAGAAAAIVYNNQEGAVSGTLGSPDGDYVPVVGISQAEGDTLIAALGAGEVIGDFVADTLTENRTTYNVIAETKGGDKDNVLVLGGHSDSVADGPGINDDGSGIVANLVIALALSQFEITNAVRFGFWSAEEFGLLGSDYYVSQLNTSETEIAKIRAYLNFDMVSLVLPSYFSPQSF